jgi:tetratricopeptide (TPR) repeat protein
MGRNRFRWLGLLVLGLTSTVQPADERPKAPPPRQRLLEGADARKAQQLDQAILRHWGAGQFEEALTKAEALLALRKKAQGEKHWQTSDARWVAETLRCILKQDAPTRKQMAVRPSLDRQANDLEERARYRDAQPLRDKILALDRQVLGEEHPGTAASFAKLGNNLHAQGHYAPAQALFEKALAIDRRVLGEYHPATATSYDNLALSLMVQSKYAAAASLLRQALAIRRRMLGDHDPETARSYNNLATNLHAQGQYAAAGRLFQKALDINLRVVGEVHAETARSYNGLARNLNAQGRYADAAPLFQKALDIRRKLYGEDHPDVAQSYNNAAGNLHTQGRFAAAGPLFQKALDIARKLLGEDHHNTATAYNNLASNLGAQGKYAAAAPLFQKALDISRKALGEDNVETAVSYSNLASNLHNRGQYTAAQPLFQKALDIFREALGEEHADTATGYNNVAYNLTAQGRYAAAGALYEKALAIRRRVLGEDHPDTANGYSNVAGNLAAQGQYAAAARLYQRALDSRRKALGEEHPDTSTSYGNLATSLNAQGQYAAARPLYAKALAIDRKTLGEDHPDTARSYSNMAGNLYAQGHYAEAESFGARAANAFARARLRLAASGLERAAVTGEGSPLPALTALLARNGKPEEAWRRFEESLARGTWDDLSARLRRTPAERDRQTSLVQALRRFDQLIEGATTAKDTPELKQRRDRLLTARRRTQDELTALAQQLEKQYGPVAGEVYDRAAIQQALPADAALVGWVDIPGEPEAADPNGERWGILLRARGGPICQRLRGSGKDGSWTEADSRLPADLRAALRDPSRDWHALADRLSLQRLQPLAKYLAAGDSLPAVRRLIVLPSSALAGLPLEICAADYTVSYAPSGTIFSYLRGLPPAAGKGVLALADPVLDTARHKPGRVPLPPGGLLVTMVVPGGNAAGAHVHADDVLVRYAGSQLKDLADISPLIQRHAKDKEVHVMLWRAGQTAERTVAGGPLGVALARQPAAEALAERYKNDQLVAQSRAGAEGDWPELPATRAEADGLRQLCTGAATPFRLLADSDASEQELDRLARGKELSGYRYIHLATHGDLDDRLPLQSAVILARDHLPDPLKQLEAGHPVYDGRLTAEKVLESWDLHAELVTLSACQTALGKYEGGEGFVGFTQALLLSGARSVCLSLWKVDDTATALLIQRFYANLLGQRPGLKKPLGKAEALAEAKGWLRDLDTEEVARAAALTQGVARGKGRKPLPALPPVKGPGAGKAARPYAHPYYWAAFVLVGDGT